MNKKNLVRVVGITLIIIFALSAFSFAFARENGNEREDGDTSRGEWGWGEMEKIVEPSIKESPNEEMAAVIRANGDFRVSGVLVNSVSSSTNIINVTFFGFSRDVNVSGAEIFGGGEEISLGDIQAGDKLNASGNYNVTTRAITVYEIKNVTMRKKVLDIQARIQQLLEMIQKLQEQLRSRL